MIRKCLMVAMVVAIGCVVAAPAQAGGTGTKKVATIRVQNGSDAAIGVTPAAPTATNLASASAFQAAGGQPLAVGAIGSFKVPAGASTLYAAYAQPFPVALPFAAGTSAQLGVTGVAGKTGYARVTGVNATPTLFFNGSSTSF